MHLMGSPRDGQTEVSDETVRILRDICREVERNPDGARAAALRLATRLMLPAAGASVGGRGGLAPWQQRKVDRFLRERLNQPVRPNELAAQIPLSVSYFHRAFKATFGETPRSYLIRLRLERAQELMLATDDPLTRIALACGFANQAQLSKLFRRWLGETPSAWRRRNLTEAQAEARRRRSTGPAGARDDGAGMG
jgi:AraC family transcriptional regulator